MTFATEGRGGLHRWRGRSCRIRCSLPLEPSAFLTSATTKKADTKGTSNLDHDLCLWSRRKMSRRSNLRVSLSVTFTRTSLRYLITYIQITYLRKCISRLYSKLIQMMVNSKINLKNGVCNIITCLYFSIYAVDQCGSWKRANGSNDSIK